MKENTSKGILPAYVHVCRDLSRDNKEERGSIKEEKIDEGTIRNGKF